MATGKRRQIIEKATELFSQYGFHPVGIDRIIDESDIARMTLYRHFAGKDDLIRAVLQHRHSALISSIEARLESLETPEQKVKGIFDWYRDWFSTESFAGCLFERALAEFGTSCPGISDVAIGYKQTLMNMLESLLCETLPRKSARQLAEVFVMLLDGATVDARAFNDPAAAKRAWQAAEVLLKSAATGDGA
ncbi:TetR/AcrR family transcriptional regulator [Trinickia fusca]|uniref:TetR/AcrR family transcriptional regulator n=1 Tax=Trinickia fusca TaxID=2419777 RepID=A0A494XSD0_9BURK|nr:TetR/AcrR family transcriptional regulator [Trinickia fusca]RKP52571.1 TetR/AcrR family transcriptional regulator [Trinickia fusca]